MGYADKVVVRLTAEQREALGRVVHTGTHPAARRRRAQILLRADADGPDAWTDEEIAEHVGTSRMTVMRVPSFHAKRSATRSIPGARSSGGRLLSSSWASSWRGGFYDGGRGPPALSIVRPFSLDLCRFGVPAELGQFRPFLIR